MASGVDICFHAANKDSPEGGPLKFLNTGVPHLDTILGGGIPEGDLCLVVGPPGSGKTTLVFQLASLTDVHWTMSGEVVLMTLIGGMGTMFGPTVGALVFTALEFYLSSIGSWVTVVEGGVFVVCVLAFREGIVGVLARRLRRPL